MTIRARDILGSWDLQRIELTGPGAESQPAPYGGKAQGILHYLPDGRMVAMIQNADRRPIEGGRRGGKPEDWLRAAKSFTAYAAAWEILPDGIVHHVDFNLFPNDVGTDYFRQARFEGEILVLETPLDGPPDTRPMRLYWKRRPAS